MMIAPASATPPICRAHWRARSRPAFSMIAITSSPSTVSATSWWNGRRRSPNACSAGRWASVATMQPRSASTIGHARLPPFEPEPCCLPIFFAVAALALADGVLRSALTGASAGLRLGHGHILAAQLDGDAALESLGGEQIAGRGDRGIAARADDVERQRTPLLANVGNGTVGERIVLAEHDEAVIAGAIVGWHAQRCQPRCGGALQVG